MRGLIKPDPGHGVAYVDWVTQEFAIAAALSGDERMAAAYASGDVYAAFARDAGLVPRDAAVDPQTRHICKSIILGIGYGMTVEGMALRAGITRSQARHLLGVHQHTYRRFWAWIEDNIAGDLFNGGMQTRHGWHRWVTPSPNVRSLQNWRIQATGAEMMRAAAIAATEVGIAICAPVHDAFLIAAPVEDIARDVAAMRAIMTAAGEAVVGMPVRTDAEIVLPPDRYMDERGAEMWGRVMGLLSETEEEQWRAKTSTGAACACARSEPPPPSSAGDDRPELSHC
jgi:DNA polymerase I-like protein with 3'-5' exonuclease and polymerase domains